MLIILIGMIYSNMQIHETYIDMMLIILIGMIYIIYKYMKHIQI
jgi:hypothetical protein